MSNNISSSRRVLALYSKTQKAPIKGCFYDENSLKSIITRPASSVTIFLFLS
jgi:hypothetical protein